MKLREETAIFVHCQILPRGQIRGSFAIIDKWTDSQEMSSACARPKRFYCLGHGIAPCRVLPLDRRASVNTRSYLGTSTLRHTIASLTQARKEDNERLYGKITSCITLIIDAGGAGTHGL